MKFVAILALAVVANAIRLHGEPPAKSLGNEGNKEQTMKEAEDRVKEGQKELKEKAEAAERRYEEMRAEYFEKQAMAKNTTEGEDTQQEKFT